MNDSSPAVTPRYHRAVTRSGKLPLSTKIFQGVGALPDTYKNFAFNTFLLFFYNQVLGMPAFYASIAIMIALTVDAITDPLVGAWSDGLQTRFGRRHLLMYASAIPLGLCLYLVFVPPAGLDDLGKFLWLTFFAVAARIAMTFFQVPWGALFAEFSDDYSERSAILTFRYLCGWIGAVTFVWCTWTFIFPSTPEFTPGHLNPAGYKVFAPIVAVLVTAAILITTHLTRREVPYLLQPTTMVRFSLPGAFKDILVAFRNRDFVYLFLGILFGSVLTGTLGALEIYMNTYFWGLYPEDLRWFTFTIVGSMAAFALIPALQSRFDKKGLLLTFIGFLLINGIAMVTLRFLDVLPDNRSPLLLQVLITNEIIRTAAGTIVGIMFVSMVADSLDKQELETGRRQEGVFSAALSFAGKATSGVGILAGGLILDFVLHFPRGINPADIDPGIVVALGIIAGIIIPLLYLFPFWIASRYSITRQIHTEIQSALRVRRGEA